jgi:hypothetical protein
MEAQTKLGIESIEKKTNGVLKSTLDVLTNYVTKQLANQKKVDFLPKDESVLENFQTPTCDTICAFLTRAVGLISQAVDGANRSHFGDQLALALQRLLLDHFKRFRVNAAGGLMVTKDIAKYVGTLKQVEWSLSKEVEASVDLLTEIGYLFIIGPEALRERSRNLAGGGTASASGGGKRLAKADFKVFIGNREDSRSVGIQSVLAGL